MHISTEQYDCIRKLINLFLSWFSFLWVESSWFSYIHRSCRNFLENIRFGHSFFWIRKEKWWHSMRIICLHCIFNWLFEPNSCIDTIAIGNDAKSIVYSLFLRGFFSLHRRKNFAFLALLWWAHKRRRKISDTNYENLYIYRHT